MGENQSKAIAASSEVSSDETLLEPMEVITRQTCSESVEEIKGKDGDRLAWHIILVPYKNHELFKQKKSESWIQIDDFGRNIKYRDKAGRIHQASGYGAEPPEQLVKWMHENYDPCAIDKSTTLIYFWDDIRLCTIQRLVPEQPLGIFPHYHRHERFHYLKLSDDYQSTLAFSAGIKSFDRVIEYNGVNIEEDSAESFQKKIDDIADEPFQLLVCSPATYAHYKKNNKHLHSNLSTVKRLKSVRDATSIRNNYELLQNNGTAERYTLMNSRGTFNENTLNTVQEIDDTEFVTAHEQLIIDTMENKPAQLDSKIDDSQVLLNQKNIRDEKKGDNKKKREDERQKLIQQLGALLMDNQYNADNGIEIHYVQCCGCGSSRIYDDRYRCLECEHYDLCGRCFDQRRETLRHMNGHAMVHFSDHGELFGELVIDINTTVTLRKFKEKYSTEEHANIACNHCQMLPIIGLRFKCDVCHDYDLCITCMEKRVHDKTHPLIAIGKSRFSEIAINDIELDDELGRGGFGTVYRAKWLSKNRPVACKVISVTPEREHLEKSFRKELAAYAELSGPYILKTYGYNIQQLSTGIRKCMLVMEYMPRGSLTSVLKQKEQIPLRRKLEMACQIASGMRKLHAHRMIHRDIRPDNILVTQDYTAKIGDMGLARVWLADENLTVIGCLAYMPLDFYTGKYNQSLDVYTFGLTMNELFTGKRHQFDLLTRRIQLTGHSAVFADLIARCIDYEPSQRPSAIEIETTLRMYKQAFERYIIEKNIKYGTMSTEDKNTLFITIYNTLHPEFNQILKSKFPPARPAEEVAVGDNNEGGGIRGLLELLKFLGGH